MLATQKEVDDVEDRVTQLEYTVGEGPSEQRLCRLEDTLVALCEMVPLFGSSEELRRFVHAIAQERNKALVKVAP